MSRLINADKLKEAINSSLNTGRETFSPEIICEAVDKQPTAFDVDKVVERIESIKENEQGACTDEQCGYCNYFNDCWDGEMCDKLALDKAIEIVKGGGVE